MNPPALAYKMFVHDLIWTTLPETWTYDPPTSLGAFPTSPLEAAARWGALVTASGQTFVECVNKILHLKSEIPKVY